MRPVIILSFTKRKKNPYDNGDIIINPMVYPNFRGVKMFKNMSSIDIFVYCHPACLTYMQSTS